MKKLLFLLVALGLTLAGVAYWINKSWGHRPPTGDFTFTPVEFGSLSESVNTTGILRPHDTLVVGSSLPGRVVQVAADFNQRLREGDVLARLDDRMAQQDLRDAGVAERIAQAGVTQAEASRAAAERMLKKQEGLARGVGRDLDLEAARKALEAAQAGVELAEAQVMRANEIRRRAEFGLSLTLIRAPYVMRSAENPALGSVLDPDVQESLVAVLGVWPWERREYTVLERKVEVDQQIAPPISARLFVLTSDLSQMLVNAQVAEGDISKVHQGQPVEFTVSTYAEEDLRFHGVVRQVRLMPASTPAAAMPGAGSLPGPVFYEAVVDVVNEQDPTGTGWRLRPGLTASLDIIQRKQDNIWKLPSAALTFQLDDQYQGEEARKKLADWQNKPDRDQWRPVWVLNEQGQPWPLFVRIGGTNGNGEGALHDAQFQQVLEWDAEVAARLDPKNPATYPRIITGAPPVSKGGLFKGGPAIKF